MKKKRKKKEKNGLAHASNLHTLHTRARALMNAPTPPPPPPSFLGVGGGGKRAFLDVVRTHGHWCVKKCGVPPPEVISSVESSSSSSSKSSVLSQRKRDDDVPELCAIVDERNRVVDFVDRERTTRERLRGRGSYVLVTTRTPRPPRGQSAVTNNNTEDQGQDQDEEEEIEWASSRPTTLAVADPARFNAQAAQGATRFELALTKRESIHLDMYRELYPECGPYSLSQNPEKVATSPCPPTLSAEAMRGVSGGICLCCNCLACLQHIIEFQ